MRYVYGLKVVHAVPPPFLSRRAFLRTCYEARITYISFCGSTLLVNPRVKSYLLRKMNDSGDDTSKAESKISKETTVSLPAIEDKIRHDSAILYERESTAKMAAAGLLEVARGSRDVI